MRRNIAIIRRHEVAGEHFHYREEQQEHRRETKRLGPSAHSLHHAIPPQMLALRPAVNDRFHERIVSLRSALTGTQERIERDFRARCLMMISIARCEVTR